MLSHSQKPVGIFSLLDEESKFPKASDLSFVNKVISNLGKHPNFSIEKKAKGKTTVFAVNHFAGTVSKLSPDMLKHNSSNLGFTSETGVLRNTF